MSLISFNRSWRPFTAALTAVLVTAMCVSMIPIAGAAENGTNSLRAQYHLTPPDHWLSDPQRPIYANGQYNLYYLYSNPNNSPGGWRHATTEDNVRFTDQGMAIPLKDGIPAWTGSTVIDENNTAGFGAGTIIALMTQPTGGDSYQQEQYLWYSTDGGFTYTPYGEPVIKNPDHTNWFRDPKIEWDAERNQWVAAIGRQQAIEMYTSPNLKDWTYQSTFRYTTPNIGGMECPDLYEITANDGTTHWVLGASVQGDYSGKVNTFAYWTGEWNGTEFVVDQSDPQWLDYGWDWYAAVSWPNHESPETSRYAIGWMNNWEYAARDIPTDVSDGYNGQMSIVRELRLQHRDGAYTLMSLPVPSLSKYVSNTVELPTTEVNGEYLTSFQGDAYELETDISWDQLSNVGIQIGRSADGARHTDIGVFANETFYVNRQRSENGQYGFYPWVETHSPFDPTQKNVHLRILVDKQSVEVFVDDGAQVHSDQVYFKQGDEGVAFYSSGGTATFSNTVFKELRVS